MRKEQRPLEVKGLHESLINRQLICSCFNCEHMNKETELCDLYKMRPPMHIIIYACGDSWMGEIPF